MNNGLFSHERVRPLFDAARALVSELEPDAVLEELLTAATEFTGARYAAIGVLHPNRVELERFVTRGIDAEDRARIGDLPRGRGVLGQLITHPEPLVLDRVSDHPASFGFPPNHPPMSTFLGVPIIIRGAPWGNLYLTDKEGGGPFTASDRDAAVLLAEWSAIAVDNARNFESSEQRRVALEAAVGALEATTEVALAVGGEPDVSRVLELIVARGRDLVDARALVIALREGPNLVVDQGSGDVDGNRLGATIDLAASAVAGVLRTGKPRRFDHDADELNDLAEELAVSTPGSALVVPLQYRSEALGVLAAFDPAHGEGIFTESDERLLAVFAASAATAVAGARSVAAGRLRSVLDAQERERARWARELHDETLQDMAALAIHLELALKAPDEGGLRDAISIALGHVQRQARTLRGLITDLRPADLDDLGLRAALGALVERVVETSSIPIRLNVALRQDQAPGHRLPAPVEDAVYRMVQEALTNAVRHSGAKRISILVEESPSGITAEVRDDGDGFDTSGPTNGFGLMGMNERVQLVKGKLQLASSARGTTVRAEVPLAADDRKHART
ncbi:GAF domain-containing protein [Paraconexibacter sp.]|uniref:sensor histidine kinase n=1 Tax=Paraconexibacter sp. TaxID=2949640 RepID=UPI00356B10E3